MLQSAFCIAHCHRSVTSATSGDHPPSFLGGTFLFNNPFLYSDSFQMGWGLKKYNFFSNFFLPVCANSYYLHETSSPFLFCCAPTMNPLGPCRRNASGSKGDISAISLLSLINLSSYPHFGAALSARQPSRACQ